jgi:hypothetical protein
MVYGHNTNLKVGNITLHIQTEDRGEPHALIDTTVYYHGRVLHRRTNNYFDLLPMNEDNEQALRMRVDDQHRTVIEELRSGALQLAIPAEPKAAAVVAAVVPGAPVLSTKLLLELANATSWLSGRNAILRVSVKEEAGAPAARADVRVEFEGSEGDNVFRGQTDAQGEAVIEFELPRIVSPEAAMVITAEHGIAKGYLKFAMRAKPRTVTR